MHENPRIYGLRVGAAGRLDGKAIYEDIRIPEMLIRLE
jgi:hypothetical protein